MLIVDFFFLVGSRLQIFQGRGVRMAFQPGAHPGWISIRTEVVVIANCYLLPVKGLVGKFPNLFATAENDSAGARTSARCIVPNLLGFNFALKGPWLLFPAEPMNPFRHLSEVERIHEIAALLATGVLRHLRKQSQSGSEAVEETETEDADHEKRIALNERARIPSDLRGFRHAGLHQDGPASG